MDSYSQSFLHLHEALILKMFWHKYSYVFIYILQVSRETLEAMYRVLESFLTQLAKLALAYICRN